MGDDHDLLRLEVETLWVVDARGRMDRRRTPDRQAAPLVAVAAGAGGMVWACSAALSDAGAERIDGVLAGKEPPQALPSVGWQPATAGRMLEILSREGANCHVERGPSFILVDPPDPTEGFECWTSASVEPAGLAGRMPEGDRESLAAPWAVALADGLVAAVCETARSAPASVEAGVWAYETYRRRGFATAAAAAWAPLAGERTVFWSTTFDNEASQRTARRLGLRPLAQWWWVTTARPTR